MHPNIELVNRFFEGYCQRDFNKLHEVVADDAKWIFPGHHNYSGEKNGFDAVIAFFDTMSGIMGKSNVHAERLFIEANDNFVVEYQHIWTNRIDGNNLNHHWCVTWKIKNKRIIEGRHFAGNQHEVDRFFHKIYQSTIA